MGLTMGRIRLPGWLERPLRSRLRQALLSDFLSETEQHHLPSIGLTDVRDRLITNGLTLAPTVLPVQLCWWRVALPVALALLCVAPLVLLMLKR